MSNATKEIAEKTLSIEEKLSKDFSKSVIRIFRQIAKYIAEDGLEEEEACILSKYEPETLEAQKVSNPLLRRLLKLADLKYKHGLISTVSASARGGDVKNAQWLLSSKYPEFNQKKGVPGSPGDTPENIIGNIYEVITESATDGIVQRRAGRVIKYIPKKMETTKAFLRKEGIK